MIKKEEILTRMYRSKENTNRRIGNVIKVDCNGSIVKPSKTIGIRLIILLILLAFINPNISSTVIIILLSLFILVTRILFPKCIYTDKDFLYIEKRIKNIEIPLDEIQKVYIKRKYIWEFLGRGFERDLHRKFNFKYYYFITIEHNGGVNNFQIKEDFNPEDIAQFLQQFAVDYEKIDSLNEAEKLLELSKTDEYPDELRVFTKDTIILWVIIFTVWIILLMIFI